MVRHFRISSRKRQFSFEWDSLDSNYIVYPVGQASARWNDAGDDREGDEGEADGYNDAYAAKTPKASDEDDED